jgi:nondiscriminating glutamyl-tRNA synthetase
MTTVKTRFAPSPTGNMHLGNARTALFSALYAYGHQGSFLLRIEDTDAERSTQAFSSGLMRDLRALSMNWHEGPEVGGEHGPYCQSERSGVYQEYFDSLMSLGKAYPCFCSPTELELSRKLQRAAGLPPRYSGTCASLTSQEVQAKLDKGLKPSLRFRVARGATVEFVDKVRGLQKFATDEIGDFVIRRGDGSPAFFFCNAVDDALMGVTDVLRGEDHLTNTPRQLLILQALGLREPQYGHIALILGTDGTPLSKRNGSRSIRELLDEGYLPLAITNYMARLGHSYTQDKLMNFQELADAFTVDRLGKSPARYDESQLKRWQKEAIAAASDAELWAVIGPDVEAYVPAELREQFLAAVRDNLEMPRDAVAWARTFFGDTVTFDATAECVIVECGATFFGQVNSALEQHGKNYTALVEQLKATSGRKGKGLFMPLRVALTGMTHGPEMAKLMEILPQEQLLARINACIDLATQHAKP